MAFVGTGVRRALARGFEDREFVAGVQDTTRVLGGPEEQDRVEGDVGMVDWKSKIVVSHKR